MADITLALRIHALSALHIGTGLGLAGVVDRRTARCREADDSRLVYIPGSSIKGRLRWHFTQLIQNLSVQKPTLSICNADFSCRPPKQPCIRCVIFGSEAYEGQMVFHDGVLSDDWRNLAIQEGGKLRRFFETENRTNVSISRRRGVSMERQLFGTEVVASELNFEAKVTGRLSLTNNLDCNGKSVPVEVGLLACAARTVTHIGGGKSRGLGRCTIAVKDIEVDGQSIEEEELFMTLWRWFDALPARSGD